MKKQKSFLTKTLEKEERRTGCRYWLFAYYADIDDEMRLRLDFTALDLRVRVMYEPDLEPDEDEEDDN